MFASHPASHGRAARYRLIGSLRQWHPLLCRWPTLLTLGLGHATATAAATTHLATSDGDADTDWTRHEGEGVWQPASRGASAATTGTKAVAAALCGAGCAPSVFSACVFFFVFFLSSRATALLDTTLSSTPREAAALSCLSLPVPCPCIVVFEPCCSRLDCFRLPSFIATARPSAFAFAFALPCALTRARARYA